MADTTPTEEYQQAGAQQAQGAAKIEDAKARGERSVEGEIEKARGVAKAQIEPNIDINDVTNIQPS